MNIIGHVQIDLSARGVRNVDPEPRVGGGGSSRRPKKNCDLPNFDGGSGC